MLAPDPDCPRSVRIFPASWIQPMPLPAYFPDRRPLEVDLGCGKGRFLLARAARRPDLNFLGIERMLRRVRKIDRRIQGRGLSNVRLLRIEAYYAVTYLIPSRCVSTYYLFFPDPWPKRRHHGHRLFNPAFMDALARTLVPSGGVHIATDDASYFKRIAGLLAADPRFYPCEPFVPSHEEKSDFERYFLENRAIHRVSVESVPLPGS